MHFTHFPLVPHICISESGQHWIRQWLVAYSAPSHYLNQCWVIVNWTLMNKLQQNFNQNTKHFIHKNASENIRLLGLSSMMSSRSWIHQKRMSSSCKDQGQPIDWPKEAEQTSNQSPALLRKVYWSHPDRCCLAVVWEKPFSQGKS